MDMRRGLSLRHVLAILLACLASHALAQRAVTFPLPSHDGEIHGDLYGQGVRGLVLAHGGSFHKESWKRQAERFADSGFLVLAIDFRGDRLNPNGTPESFGSDADNAADVLAAASYLRSIGATSVSAVGASLGGDAVGDADALAPPGTFARIVLLAASGGDAPEKLSGRKLFIVARDDRRESGPRLPEIVRAYRRAPQPKKLVVISGSAHAQFLFDTDQGPRLLSEMLRFLTAP